MKMESAEIYLISWSCQLNFPGFMMCSKEAMETLSSTFSSLGFKKEKPFLGKEQKFMYVPKVPKPKFHYMFNGDRTFSSTMNGLHAESSIEKSKVPISSSCDENT